MLKTIPIFYDDQVKDCQTCAYTHGALCLSPEYKNMSDAEKKVFWSKENLDPPCRLWVSNSGPTTSD